MASPYGWSRILYAAYLTMTMIGAYACACNETTVGISTDGVAITYLDIRDWAVQLPRIGGSPDLDVYDEGDACFDAVRVRELLRSGMSPQAVIADSSDDRISVAFLRDDLLVISNHDHALPASGVAIWVIRI